MSIEIARLDLGAIEGGLIAPRAPFFGYAIRHPGGVALVDTGWGGPTDRIPQEWRIVVRSIADALAEHGLSPLDVTTVISTHLHQDHYGQHAIFRDVPIVVQRAELERARRETPHMAEYFDFAGARFELLEGDAEILPGVHALATPGHTLGHQSVLIEEPGRRRLLVGDAAYTAAIWDDPASMTEAHPAWPLQVQAGYDAWCDSLARLRALEADELHFCHDPEVPGGHGHGHGGGR